MVVLINHSIRSLRLVLLGKNGVNDVAANVEGK
jgi:hypothetical protein